MNAGGVPLVEQLDELRERGIDIVRISYSDMIGVDRGRAVLLEAVPSAVEHGLAFCRAVFHTSPVGEVANVQGGLVDGLPDVTVVPDLSTLTPVPWDPGVMWCIGDVFNVDGTPAGEAPRNVLAAVRDQFAEVGLSPVVGPELEFYVCEPDSLSPNGYRRYADDLGHVYVVGRKSDPEGLLPLFLRHFRDAGLGVTAGNREFSPGQFEINMRHSAMLDAADRSFRLKAGVQEVARSVGKQATFMPKPFNDQGGSGFHFHISLDDGHGGNAFDDPDGEYGLSTTGRHAIAGVLEHAPALAAILNPTVNSYKRFGPDTFAPWLIDWGLDNRSAMVRVPPERGAGSRMEVRLGDASANPYLAIAAVGAAMYLGITEELPLQEPLDGYGYDPATAPMLPKRLPEALDALEADKGFAKVLGEFFVTSYLQYKRDEASRFEQHVTDWEFREYAYHL